MFDIVVKIRRTVHDWVRATIFLLDNKDMSTATHKKIMDNQKKGKGNSLLVNR